MNVALVIRKCIKSKKNGDFKFVAGKAKIIKIINTLFIYKICHINLVLIL